MEDFRIVQRVYFTSHRTNSSTVGGMKDFARIYRETQTGVASTTALSAFMNQDGLEKQQVQELVTEVAGDAATGTLENLAPTGGHFWDYLKRARERDLFIKGTNQQNPAEVEPKIDEVETRHGKEIRRLN